MTMTMAMTTAVVVGMAAHVPAFAAPGAERRLARRLRKTLSTSSASSANMWGISVHQGDVYQFLRFLLSPAGVALRHERRLFQRWLTSQCHLRPFSLSASAWVATRSQSPCMDPMHVCHIQRTTHASAEDTSVAVVLVVYRPQPLLPLCMASARRAVRLVARVVTLVTANAYISTLGGGHFLCMHLQQAKRMARLQIAISYALQDPVLASKCRINLAYNAMREGRFRRAQRLIREEGRVALALASEELVSVCHAAHVYLVKTYRLHQEHVRALAAHERNAQGERMLVDNFYRQRVVRTAK